MELAYPSDYLVRKVKPNGDVGILGTRVNVSMALAGYEVGLERLTTNEMSVWFCRLCVGAIDLADQKFQAIGTGRTNDRGSTERLNTT